MQRITRDHTIPAERRYQVREPAERAKRIPRAVGLEVRLPPS